MKLCSGLARACEGSLGGEYHRQKTFLELHKISMHTLPCIKKSKNWGKMTGLVGLCKGSHFAGCRGVSDIGGGSPMGLFPFVSGSDEVRRSAPSHTSAHSQSLHAQRVFQDGITTDNFGCNDVMMSLISFV